jgi:hypothetical protein
VTINECPDRSAASRAKVARLIMPLAVADAQNQQCEQRNPKTDSGFHGGSLP